MFCWSRPVAVGKLHCWARVASELRTDTELSGRLFPIRFMEESQEIFNLADFWLETLFYLARESTQRDPDLSRELQDTHAGLAGEWRGENLEERARAAVLEAADRIGMKLVLMVENLQALCECVDDDFGWKLRGALQSEPQIMLLATATSRFKGLDDAREPFFELFRVLRLEPLDTDQCRSLWQMVTRDAVTGREIRPLQILTGGNPRLLIIIADFARHRSLRELMEDLVSLIDDHTEYFRAHLEGFAKTERRVYLAVIDLWQPSTTGEIAARARMDVRAVSALLGRLVERGAVVVEGSGRKRMYTASERLYSIYYKLRRERDEAAVVRNLIHFMAVFYSTNELAEMADKLTLEATESPATVEGIRRAAAEMPQVRDAFSSILWPDIDPTPKSTIVIGDKKAQLLLAKIISLVKKGKSQEAINIVDRTLASEDTKSPKMPESFIAMALLTKGVAHWELKEFQAVKKSCEEVIRHFGDDDVLQVAVAIALVNKGFAHRELNEANAAIAACNEVVERFGGNGRLELPVQAATALVNKGDINRRLGNFEAAIAAYDDVLERFKDTDTPDLQIQVASALINKGVAQDRLGNTDVAIETYDDVIACFGRRKIFDLQEQIAMALINKALALRKIGETETAISIFDEVIERFEHIDTPVFQEAIARALFNKGVACEQLGRLKEAIEIYDTAIRRFGESDVPDIQIQVVEALFNKGEAHIQLGHSEEALHTSSDLEQRLSVFGIDDDVAREWRMKWTRMKALAAQGKHKISIDLFRSAYSVFDPDNETLMREFLRLLFNFIAAGISERELVKILSSDKKKLDTLEPLVTALRQRAGESIRAPVEVLEVAKDIRKRIERRRENPSVAEKISRTARLARHSWDFRSHVACSSGSPSVKLNYRPKMARN